ncbi:MAG: Fic family protein [Chitinophagales bacterium]|nr:Fic family protein [Chitinophagales bacterium]
MKKELLHKIDQLQAEIATHYPFSKDLLNKINYKLRLDWNYYSNKMEGGTLTRQETRSVMVENLEIHNKPLKDVIEMKGHDNVVLDILKITKGEMRISEKKIKDMHQAIMYEENPETRKLIGKWKEENNEIINYKGEKYHFLDKAKVPDALHDLLNKTNLDVDAFFKGQPKQHPIESVVYFHKQFLEIHPFFDGNWTYVSFIK